MAGPTVPTDYSSWAHGDLIARVTELERQLRSQTMQLATRSSPPQKQKKYKKPRVGRAFDPSKYSTRHIALKIAYMGQRYNGYEHANGNMTPLPTIEEVLWKALRKSRLISPPSDETMDVVWSRSERAKKPLLLNWDGCQYSKCGRTDRGVSAFGQVIGIRVRSNRPLPNSPVAGPENLPGEDEAEIDVEDAKPPEEFNAFEVDKPTNGVIAFFDDIKDELPYSVILNAVLPPDIRVLAWCPRPPQDFDARFSCRERRYKYFFTNPGFLPTPGEFGLEDADGQKRDMREGWLDIGRMREAAKKLEGKHDFRNFSRIDTSKQQTSFERTITHVEIGEVVEQYGPTAFSREPQLGESSSGLVSSPNSLNGESLGPRIYTFTVHGSAFLWHQVRHMVAILFLIGQRLESPILVDELLDIETNPSRPTYGMAVDGPLVLWDCIFPKVGAVTEQALDWIYAGDAVSLASLSTKGDGKYGPGGVVDELFSTWHRRKISEVMAGSLLDLVIRQGDGSALGRGGFRDREGMPTRSQKLFDGSAIGQLAGKYVPAMQKPRTDTVEVQNERYRATRANRELHKTQ